MGKIKQSIFFELLSKVSFALFSVRLIRFPRVSPSSILPKFCENKESDKLECARARTKRGRFYADETRAPLKPATGFRATCV